MKESYSYPLVYLVQSREGIDSLFVYRTIQAISIGKAKSVSSVVRGERSAVHTLSQGVQS